MSLAEIVATQPELAVQTDGLTKTYGILWAVDRVRLEVPSGSVYGLIGPNGAGKTTTFQILATLLQRDSGTVRIFGMDPERDPAGVRRVLGYMPDFFGLYDDVRVGEYLQFFAAAYRIPVSHRRKVSEDLLELVDLTNKKEAFVESLSRGMKQRLGLARALVHDPQLLILDEPASGLDPRARVELRELLIELRSMGKTIVISSHILSELEEVCTHIGVLEAGKLLAQGEPNQILSATARARVFRMRVADKADKDKARELLLQDRSISSIVLIDDGLQFQIAADDHGAARVLAQLTSAAIPVVEFAEVPTDLEDLFLKITKGIVQ
jgi:ABC-2 type transport system ATP-binding protein